MSGERPRFSISGWYHKDVLQEGSAHASLQQLQMKAGEDQIQEHTDFEGKHNLAAAAVTSIARVTTSVLFGHCKLTCLQYALPLRLALLCL